MLILKRLHPGTGDPGHPIATRVLISLRVLTGTGTTLYPYRIPLLSRFEIS